MLCYSFYIQLFILFASLGFLLDHRSGKFILFMFAYLAVILIATAVSEPLWITVCCVVVILVSLLFIGILSIEFHWYDVWVLIISFNTLLCIVQGITWMAS